MRVDPEQIRAHAKRVDTVATDVGGAGDSGGGTIGGEAFGVLC